MVVIVKLMSMVVVAAFSGRFSKRSHKGIGGKKC